MNSLLIRGDFDVGPLRTIFESSWQAAILVLVVLGVQRLFRQRLTPAWRHALWWIVLVRLLVPVTPPSAWSLFNLLPVLPPAPTSSRSSSAAATVAAEARPVSDAGAAMASSGTIPGESPPEPTSRAERVSAVIGSTTSEPGAAARSAFPVSLVGAGALGGTIWLAGAAMSLLGLGIRHVRFSSRLRRRMRPGAPERRALLEECRIRMGVRRQVKLLEGDAVSGPALFGVFRTRLLLPGSVASAFSPEALRHVFLHELAHVRRGDLPVNALWRVLRCVHLFNPVLAWAFRRVRADRELATDARVLRCLGPGEARAYGHTIVRLLEGWMAAPGRPAVLGMAEEPASLERRLRAIAGYTPPSRRAAAAALLLAFLAAVSWTNAQPGSSIAAGPAPVAGSPTPTTPDPGGLVTRVHRFPPEVIGRALGVEPRPVPGDPRAAPEIPSAAIQERFLALVAGAGVSTNPPNAVFFNDRLGLVLIRATTNQADVVAAVLEGLAAAAPRLAEPVVPAPAQPSGSAKSDELRNLQATLADETSVLAGLRQRYTEAWPAVVESRARVAALEQRIAAARASPSARGSADGVHGLELTTQGWWRLDGTPVEPSSLGDRLAALAQAEPDAALHLTLPRPTPWKEVVQALDAAKAAGISKLSVNAVPGSESPASVGVEPIWKSAADLPAKPAEIDRLVLIACESDENAVSVSNRRKVLESEAARRLFASSGVQLYRIDCSKSGDALSTAHVLWGLPPTLPTYLVYHPARKGWTLLAGTLTNEALAALLNPGER